MDEWLNVSMSQYVQPGSIGVISTATVGLMDMLEPVKPQLSEPPTSIMREIL